MSNKDPYQLAQLSLKVGCRSASKVSFQDASCYYNAGIEFLKTEEWWTDQYNLALQLHEATALAELSNHNFGLVNGLIEEIF